MAKYNHAKIEPKWQKYWDDHQSFKTPEKLEGPKFYVLDMFPYPSGAGLHVGHPEGYTATDIMARYKRAQGVNVLHPMGWDAFGLPAEQYALQTGTHPAETTQKNVDNFRRQLKSLGFSYDWSREVNTTDPNYFKWTQWIFLQLYKRGLAYISEIPVNFCPALGTVLANEEVINGRSERGNHPVIRKPMRQWMLKITAYADRLLAGLEDLDWPESIKEMQRNWIGRSRGAELLFDVDGANAQIRVFTTRPDTLFGATYMVLAPEHDLVDVLTTPEQRDTVRAYVEEASKKSDLARTDLNKDKSGVFTGGYAVNPVNGAKIPVYVADYVLISYGTGAIMAVPGHDSRDWEFAKVHGLDIVEVIAGGDVTQEAYTGHGKLVNSGPFDGMSVEQGKEGIVDMLAKKGKAQPTINYRLRDWLFSRQRYWGEPFPVVFDEDGNHHPLPEEKLPLTLPPMDDFQPAPDGSPPLSKATEWLNFQDEDGRKWRRETNTMPQWAGSCWYYLRYIDPHNSQRGWDPEKEKYWMPVDLYVGGAEHAVLHLLYARFWHMVLHDAGLVSTPEPFKRLINQGLITSYSFKDKNERYVDLNEVQFDGKTAVWEKNGEHLTFQVEKMSKSLKNVINPDDILQNYGADAFRLYEMFMGPLEMSKPWNTASIEGVRRFLERTWRLVIQEETDDDLLRDDLTDGFGPEDALRLYHQTVKGVSEDVENLRFNTAISKMMVLVNHLTKLDQKPRAAIEGLLKLLSPFAPHIAEELWQRLGHDQSISKTSWPTFDEALAKEDTIEVVVQVNGKKRGNFEVAANADKAAILEQARALDNVLPYLDGMQVLKEIYVQGRLVNFVVKPK